MEISIGSYKVRVEILVLIVVVFWVLFGHLLCSCCRVSLKEGLEMAKDAVKPDNKNKKHVFSPVKEGFVGSNNSAYGPEFATSKDSGVIMPPSQWNMPNLTYSPGTVPDAGVKAIWDRPQQPVPLPEGELDMFATTDFKPECCPNTYTSSTGCACMTVEQSNFLRSRGSNNVPYSEY
uniref:Uncharacterized protein n=1 Tax=viral metagenome TaxID=1070528 RepID=A0A6C0IV97_9ZZZZ